MNQSISSILFAATFLGFSFGMGQDSGPPDRQRNRLVDPLEGRGLYESYCAVCHGDDAKGGGPMAKALRTTPPDLTHIWMRNGGKFPLERVQKIISGEVPVGSHGTRDMPLWGPIFAQGAWSEDLGRGRIHNLAKYLEKIQAN